MQQVEQRTVKSSIQRLSAFLVRLCPEGPGSAAIDLPTEKTLLAARLGIQPETLSRALAKLRANGIETHERQVLVPDICALRRWRTRAATAFIETARRSGCLGFLP